MNINNCAERPYIRIQRGTNGNKYDIEIGNNKDEKFTFRTNARQALIILEATKKLLTPRRLRESGEGDVN